MRLNPDFGPNSVNLPPLPLIKDARIREQVFTHRSVAARLTHVFEDHPDDPSPDNEKYEHLGDSVLGMIVTNMMFELFPGLRVGPSTKIRSLVVANSTLADISKRYRLPDRLRLHQAQALTLRASTNIQADVFEAFIGGLFRDQGLFAVQAWLRPLFEPFAREAYHTVRKQYTLPPLPPSQLNGTDALSGAATGQALSGPPSIGHLALFNQQLAKMNKKVEWVHSDGNEPVLPDVIVLPPPALGGTPQVGGAVKLNGTNGGGMERVNGSGVGGQRGKLNPNAPAFAFGQANGGGSQSPSSISPTSSQSFASPDSPSSSTSSSQTSSPPSEHQSPTWYADPGLPADLRIKGTHTTPVWYVKVFVDGEFYGRGRGNTKKAARNEAAREGLGKLGIEV